MVYSGTATYGEYRTAREPSYRSGTRAGIGLSIAISAVGKVYSALCHGRWHLSVGLPGRKLLGVRDPPQTGLEFTFRSALGKLRHCKGKHHNKYPDAA